MTAELYRVVTIVRSVRGHRDVAFWWFACRPEGFFRWPYADCVERYDKLDKLSRIYTANAVNQRFSKDEAEALKAFLDEHYGSEGPTTIEQVKLPIPADTMGMRGLPVGGATGFFMLDQDPKYSLPFEAQAYYDLRDCEPEDKSVPARHHFPSGVIMDGKVITDHAGMLELWRAGKLAAGDEIPPREPPADGEIPF